MTNRLYDKGRQGIGDQSIAMLTANIKAVLVDTGAYTANFATDDNLDDIAVGARLATSANLASKTFTDGVFDAADISFGAVTSVTAEAVVIYVDTGTASTSRLVAYIDTAAGLPTPALTGQVVDVLWDNGANRIFKL